MTTLRELQARFRDAVLDADARVASAIVDDGLPASARLAVYRHHLFTTLTVTLESTYPVVARLVDPRFFRYAAHEYIRRDPPAGPCLFEYGGTFAEFLGCFAPSRHLGYLPDVARLEWAMNVALHAPDAAPIESAILQAGGPVALHPSVTLLASPWPIDAIWRANQPGSTEDRVDVDSGGVRLQVWRADDEVLWRALSPAAFALRDGIARTGRLEAAAERALAAEPDGDLTGLLHELLGERILVRPG